MILESPIHAHYRQNMDRDLKLRRTFGHSLEPTATRKHAVCIAHRSLSQQVKEPQDLLLR